MKGDESHAGGGPTTIVAAGNQPIPRNPRFLWTPTHGNPQIHP